MEPATYGCEVGRVEDEPVYLRLQSARPDGSDGSEAGAGAEPVICIPVMPFQTWQVVKRCIKERWPGLKCVPDTNIRLLHKSVELRSGSMVADYNMHGGESTARPVELQYLIIDQGHERGHKGERSIGLYVDAQVPCTPSLRERVHASLAALLSGIQPRLTDEGTGATYMLRDTLNRHNLAVFKPKDEEAFAPQNPRGYVGEENSTGLRQGVLSSQQAAREVAAYLLDHENFAGVPETTLVHGKHPKFVKVRGKNNEMKVVWKIGAFQAFVETKDTAGNFAPQVFGVADVHRVGILDLRIVNLDRNDGNLLVRHGRGSSRYELVPIDHGLSLPDRLEVYPDDIAWMSWPQAHKPFGERELAYIRTLNGARDARLLAKCLGVRRECLRLLEVTTRLLQIGAEFGLSLYEIGTILYRVERGSDAPGQPSKLEQIIESCLDSALAVTGDGPTANASATLLGLDLQHSSRQLGNHRMARQVSTGDGDQKVGLTPQLRPQLRPSSPLTSPLSTSPNSGDMPPHLSLDGLSESDTPASPEVVLPAAAGAAAERAEDGRPGDAALAPKKTPGSFRGSYRGGSTRLRQRTSAALAHQRSEGNDTQGSIFARPNLQGADWSPELEKAFRRHLNAELSDYIRKAFRRSSPPSGEAPAPDAAVEPAAGARTVDTSLASALPSVMPPDRPSLMEREEPTADTSVSPPLAPAKALYVPPHLRRASMEAKTSVDRGSEGVVLTEEPEAAPPPQPLPPAQPPPDEAAEAAGQEEVAAEAAAAPSRMRYVPPQRRSVVAAEEAPKAKYVPPFMRKAAERAAAEALAADGAANGEAAEAAPALPSAAPTSLPRDASGGNGRFGFCVNQGVRASMEDAVDAVLELDGAPGAEFYAVYDGHGGTYAVDFVKRRLPSVIASRAGFGDPGRIDEVMQEAFTLADEELLGYLRKQPRSPALRPVDSTQHHGSDGTFVLSSGCVGCIALVRGTTVHVANLGDCRALLCHSGEMAPLTVDHRPEVNEAERERLHHLGIEVSSDGYLHGRIGVSRAFGDWAWDCEEKCRGLLCRPEVVEAQVTPDTEFLLLACDGVFEKVPTREAGQIVRRSLRAKGDAKAAAEVLVKHAIRRNTSDNVSAVVVLFKRPPADVERAAPRLFAAAAGRAPQEEAEPPAAAPAADAAASAVAAA